MTDDIYSALGEVDVCFVIDTTSSMGPYIHDAKQHAKSEAERIASDGDLNVRFAIVKYRDHAPQDPSFAFKAHEFMDLEHFQKEIQTLEPFGGGDIAESVYDGLYHAAGLQWRPNADKSVILIGDAPPHGYNLDGELGSKIVLVTDAWSEGCPCGLTARGIIEVYSMQHITLNAAVIGGIASAKAAFSELAEACRGKLFTIDVTVPEMTNSVLTASMGATSGTVTDTRRVAAAYRDNPGATFETISGLTGLSVDAVSASVGYASSRGYNITGTGEAISVDGAVGSPITVKPGESETVFPAVSWPKDLAEGR